MMAAYKNAMNQKNKSRSNTTVGEGSADDDDDDDDEHSDPDVTAGSDQGQYVLIYRHKRPVKCK